VDSLEHDPKQAKAKRGCKARAGEGGSEAGSQLVAPGELHQVRPAGAPLAADGQHGRQGHDDLPDALQVGGGAVGGHTHTHTHTVAHRTVFLISFSLQ